MVRYGNFQCFLLLVMLSSCLEEDLSQLSEDQAYRLLVFENSKVWESGDLDLTLTRFGTQNTFFLQRDSLDTLSFGSWSLSVSANEAFTDSIYFTFESSTSANMLEEFYVVQQLTSQHLLLLTAEDRVRFTSQ